MIQIEASFLMNMDFGSDLIGDDSGYGYGSTGEKKKFVLGGNAQ